MSKNVAVFVDVANIFYAAKAAGVDIDYVTLLKSAVAGRDFVRAYAYTGLDPENENQRQFHAFLARSGYKVVSKDIRKYGDGKIKANLDIELVVDMMRTSRNLDIAVIVSGDGDFAPAIRAVQQMGVRCEVISFRGNTSSDLIEVADVFTDITQIARVEKGSSRSGRRVAAEGDLSMTEVPDKETEGAPRRRRGRGRGGERELQPVAAASSAAVLGAETSGMPGNLIVLPGEKLSRVAVTASGAPSGDEVDEGDEFAAEELEVGDAEGAGDAGELVGPISGAQDRALEAGEELDGDGRRRRRRRGGRGRGRGRGGEREALPVQPVAAGEEDEEVLDYETPRLPQASTFGSVWDSQLGVPSVPLAGTGDPADDEDDDEPAIPEYLLAERRGRNQRSPAGPGAARRPGGGRMQGTGRTARPGSYQSAIDRERFGRSGSSSLGPGYGGPRRDDQRRDDRGRSDRPRGPRREDRVRETAVPATSRPSNGDPWSEVPPEVEELLRAELARRGGGGSAVRDRETSVEPTSRVGEKGIGELEPEETRDVPAEVTESVATETQVAATPPATVAPGAPAPRVRRAPRRTAAVPVGTDPETAAAGVGADDASGTDRGTQLGAGLEAAATSEVEAKPRRRVTRRKTATSEEQEAAGGATTVGTARASAEPVDGAEAADVEPAPRRRAVRRRTTAAEDGEAAGRPEVASVSSEGDALPATPAATGEAAEAAPRRRTTRRRKIGEEEQA